MSRHHPFVCARCKRQTRPAYHMCIYCAGCEQDFEQEMDAYKLDDARAEAAEELFARISRARDMRPSGWGER